MVVEVEHPLDRIELVALLRLAERVQHDGQIGLLVEHRAAEVEVVARSINRLKQLVDGAGRIDEGRVEEVLADSVQESVLLGRLRASWNPLSSFEE